MGLQHYSAATPDTGDARTAAQSKEVDSRAGTTKRITVIVAATSLEKMVKATFSASPSLRGGHQKPGGGFLSGGNTSQDLHFPE